MRTNNSDLYVIFYNFFKPQIFMPLKSFKSVIFRKINLYFHVNSLRMEWTELHDLNLCEEVLVVEPWKHPYRSKERGDLWNDIGANLNASGRSS